MLDQMLGAYMNENEQGWKRYYNKDVHSRASAKYNKKSMRQVGVSFHVVNEADLLARLDAETNKNGYIKRLIRDDIKRTGWTYKAPAPVSTEPVEPVPTREQTPEELAELEAVKKAWGDQGLKKVDKLWYTMSGGRCRPQTDFAIL